MNIKQHVLKCIPNIQLLIDFFYHVGKEPDGSQILLRDDMNITIDQIITARSGKAFSKKWPDGRIPYDFDSSDLEEYEVSLSQDERNIVKKVAERFNKDLNGCASIR